MPLSPAWIPLFCNWLPVCVDANSDFKTTDQASASDSLCFPRPWTPFPTCPGSKTVPVISTSKLYRLSSHLTLHTGLDSFLDILLTQFRAHCSIWLLCPVSSHCSGCNMFAQVLLPALKLQHPIVHSCPCDYPLHCLGLLHPVLGHCSCSLPQNT